MLRSGGKLNMVSGTKLVRWFSGGRWRSLEFDEAGSLNKKTHKNWLVGTIHPVKNKNREREREKKKKQERSGSNILTRHSSYNETYTSSMIRGAPKMEGSLHISSKACSSVVGVSAPFPFSYYAAARREREVTRMETVLLGNMGV